ncbi:MAG: threonylcarbamoyl-AMP synthase [Bacteroidetes bacterium HGW-Bacteroidetes-21]|jgi:tRNA threonylcarbamoyl adenosine modification protein (Sua5/YciO/YrdC/YwlC family)|nr:MAG: threonylcarbamoyl-AMP synthase [Bacteroidetes bacterium HGW-Bacteroidetes-21]
MLLKLFGENPNPRILQTIVDTLKNGGVIIYPTDSIYAFGCDMNQQKAIERIAKIKNINPEKAQFSLICHDLSHISEFTKQLDNSVFKLMKKNLPGPFTFILEANSNVPRLLKMNKKKTIGIRVPANNIAREIVRELGNPIISTTVIDEEDMVEYTTDPELIHEKYEDRVDIVIDGGYGNYIATAVVDCTSDEITIVREGLKELEW